MRTWSRLRCWSCLGSCTGSKSTPSFQHGLSPQGQVLRWIIGPTCFLIAHSRQMLFGFPPLLSSSAPGRRAGYVNYPFSVIVLARNFRDWWRIAAFEGLRRTVCRNLCLNQCLRLLRSLRLNNEHPPFVSPRGLLRGWVLQMKCHASTNQRLSAFSSV